MNCPFCNKPANQIAHYNNSEGLYLADAYDYEMSVFEGPMAFYGCGNQSHFFWVAEEDAKKYDKNFISGLCESVDD